MVGPRGPAPGTYVVFSATQSSPDFTRIYSESGGPINAAAIPWQTDFSSSGAAFASHCQLQRDRPQQVWVRADALHQTSDEDVAAELMKRSASYERRACSSLNTA